MKDILFNYETSSYFVYEGTEEEYEQLKKSGVQVAAVIRCFEGGTWGGYAMHIYQIYEGKAYFTPHQNLPELRVEEAPIFQSPEDLAKWFIETAKNPVSDLVIRWTELV